MRKRTGEVSVALILIIALVGAVIRANVARTGHALPLVHKARVQSAVRQHDRGPVFPALHKQRLRVLGVQIAPAPATKPMPKASPIAVDVPVQETPVIHAPVVPQLPSVAGRLP